MCPVVSICPLYLPLESVPRRTFHQVCHQTCVVMRMVPGGKFEGGVNSDRPNSASLVQHVAGSAEGQRGELEFFETFWRPEWVSTVADLSPDIFTAFTTNPSKRDPVGRERDFRSAKIRLN